VVAKPLFHTIHEPSHATRQNSTPEGFSISIMPNTKPMRKREMILFAGQGNREPEVTA
jgi:hypothetical protein